MIDEDHDYIVSRLIDLNGQIKEETGFDLLQKSPQALAILCLADVLSGVSSSLESIKQTIDYSDFSCHGGD